MRRDGPEAQNGETEEQAADPCDCQEFRPTTTMPAPRERIDCAKDTKCVEGEACSAVASHGGMLSSGVLLPESIFIVRKTNM